jgi:hypothetical protein
MIRVRGIIKAFVVFLISLVGFLLLLFLFLNLPFSHRFVTQKVNNIFTGSGIPVHINSVNKVFPWSVYVQGALIHTSGGDTIVYAGNIRAGLKALALFKKKIVLPSVCLEKVMIILSRNSAEEQLNIAEAFSKGKAPKPVNQNDNKSPWEISLGSAEVKELSFRMADSVAGIFVSQDIQRIKIETNAMSLTGKTILVKFLGIEGATGSLTLNSAMTKEKSESGSSWNFGLEELDARNINFVFEEPVDKIKLDLLAGEIGIKAKNTDLNKKYIDFNQITVSRTDIALRMDNKVKSPVKEETTSTDYFDWDIRGDLIKIQDVAFQMAKYSDTAEFSPLTGFSVIGLGMKLSDLKINKSDVNAGIEDLKFDLGNGFSMKELDGRIGSGSGSTRINVDIETTNSKFNMEGLADANISEIIKNPSVMHKAKLSIRNTDFSLEDIFCFKPDLKKIPGIITLAGLPVTVEGDIQLDGSDITIPSFTLSQRNSPAISIQGKISDIFVQQNAICDLKADFAKIDNEWLKKVLTEVAPKVYVPDFKSLSVEGTISDSLKAPDFRIKLNSDIGIINILGRFDFNRDKFSVKSNFNNLQLGEILNNKTLGAFSGSGDIEGEGIKRKAINAEAVIVVDSIGIMDYNYTKTKIVCSIQPGKYKLQLDIDDPSMQINLTASANMTDSQISGKAEGSFLADLYNLHFYKDTIVAEGKLSVNLNVNRDKIDGDAILSGIKLTTPEKIARINNFATSLKSDTLRTSITSVSDFFSASAQFENSRDNIGRFLKSYKVYFTALIDPGQADSLKNISFLPRMSGNIDLSYHSVLDILIPDSTLSFKKLSLSIKSDVENRTINYGLKGTDIRFKTFEAGNLNAGLIDSSATIDLNVLADTCKIGPQTINRIHIASHFSEWKSLTSLSVKDNQSRFTYNFEISTGIDSNNIVMKIPSGQLILNGINWQMDPPGFLRMNLTTKDFIPSVRMHTDSDSSVITLFKDQKNGWDNFNLELKNVALSSLVRSDLLPGKPDLSISGSASYSKNEALGGKVTTDLLFSDVSWSDLAFSKITLKGTTLSDTAGNYNFKINASLDTAEIRVNGKRENMSDRDIEFQFKLIPVNTIQPFVKKYLSELGGSISGGFNLSSRNGVNDFSGDLLINGGKLRINALNSLFRMPEEKIILKDKKLVLNDFTVLDSLNNKLLVNGNINFSNKPEVIADLEITSLNLQILNKQEEKNSTFYGNIFIDSRLSIKGPVSGPVLKGKINLAHGTDIYFLQKESLNLSESAKVLTFVSNKPSDRQTGLKSETGRSIYNKTSVESIVEIDPSTRINIKLSKRMFNIDLKIQGGGELAYNMLVNSQVNLTGKYEISEGSADLKMVGWPSKFFRITKGGFIRWDGKLDDPELQFEATNRVKSSYVNPVDNKERYVDFDVTLKISNRLSTMDILFTINTSDQYLMSIINTLSPDEQMRQAITILLFETIDLPGISTSSSYMSEQVNQMVATQLNQLTKTTIKGVDISFGIDTYTQGTASGGQETKTSLSYEVKKNLMNNRAQVEVSGRVSDDNSQSHSSNVSLNNFSFEYRIDSAATKFLKVYNEHSYEDVFEGDVVITGIGFTYRKSYPSLGDIWKRDDRIRKPKSSNK